MLNEAEFVLDLKLEMLLNFVNFWDLKNFMEILTSLIFFFK